MIKYIFDYILVWFHIYNHHCEEEKTYPWPEQISEHNFFTAYLAEKSTLKIRKVYCHCGYNKVKE